MKTGLFDAAWLIALGHEDLVFQIRWLDAMLLWKHWVGAPEGDDVPAAKRKSYSLEAAMHEFFPDEAGFKEFKNFQTQDPAELQQLLFRCKEDTRFAVRLAEWFWSNLTDEQRQAALIEAQCIPQVAKTYVPDRPGHDRRYALDSTKLRTAFGWAPRISWEEGICDTVRWYRDHPEWWRAVKDGSYQQYYQNYYRTTLGANV